MRHLFDTGSIQTIVMIACDKDFMPVIQRLEPLDKSAISSFVPFHDKSPA